MMNEGSKYLVSLFEKQLIYIYKSGFEDSCELYKQHLCVFFLIKMAEQMDYSNLNVMWH